MDHGPTIVSNAQSVKDESGTDGLSPFLQSNSSWDRQFSQPTPTLRSNDHQAALRQKLAARKVRHCVKAAQPYLSHFAYIKYRDRARKDTDKDGQIIWSDEIENAFQNALLYIPPMGKKKKSQHGRPHGRNMLISEWIKQATGQERTRKQISSHFQVFDKMFVDVPEWWAVSKECERAEGEIPDMNAWYENSIEDLVRHSRAVQCSYLDNIGGFAPENSLGNSSQSHVLKGLEFEIFINPPDSIDRKIHRYTSMQYNTAAAAPSPLEDVKGWRTSFPALAPVVDNTHRVDNFEIILLTSTLQLMEDFPPPGSKLAINLELDFTVQDYVPVQYDNELQTWNCKTHIYHRGKLLHSTENPNCDVDRSCIVRPSFESKWWAHKFVQFTEKRRRAQDSNNEAAMAAADESTKNFLQTLTVVQEISAGPDHSPLTQGVWIDGVVKYRRTAVLLWKFLLAPTATNGSTNWVKLIPPPHRTTTNSPPPSLDYMAVSPFTIDSTLKHQYADGDVKDFGGAPDEVPHCYQSNVDEEVCQDGFMMLPQPTSFNMVHHDFNVDTIYDEVNQPLDEIAMDTDFSLSAVNSQQHEHEYTGSQYPATFPASVPTNENEEHDEEQIYRTQLERYSASRVPSYDQNLGCRREPLREFDGNTHRQLQAQLGHVQDDFRIHYDDHSSLVPAHHAALHHLNGANSVQEEMNHALTTTTHDQYSEDGPATDENAPVKTSPMTEMAAPVAIRPSLQHHHSFACLTTTGAELGHDTAHDEFTRLLERFETTSDPNLDANPSFALPALAPLLRTQSQPASPRSRVDDHFTSQPDEDDGFVRVKMEDITGLD